MYIGQFQGVVTSDTNIHAMTPFATRVKVESKDQERSWLQPSILIIPIILG